MDGVSLEKIAREFSTPLYVYSAKQIRNRFMDYIRAFEGMNTLICYAVKANYSGHILKMISSMGGGADVVSGGELYMALRAGIEPEKIVFAGVGKTRSEIEEAVNRGICFLNIESAQELETIQEVAAESEKSVGISFRINPDIDPQTHPSISTGLKENKFGIFPAEAMDLYRRAASMKNIQIKGVHVHVGSQITSSGPILEAARYACVFADRLKSEGIEISYIDIGGGLGINYEGANPPTPSQLAGEIGKVFKGRSETLVLEPGRSIVGEAGVLLTEINYIKKVPGKNFVIVDAGFNDLVRPAMYGSHHRIVPVEKEGEKLVADVVGPVCESSDFLAESREVEGIKKGNILAVMEAGAYGFSMASNYNSRPRPAEVMIDEGRSFLIRRREEPGDLVDTEV